MVKCTPPTTDRYDCMTNVRPPSPAGRVANIRGTVEDVLTFPSPSPHRAEADQRQLHPSEDARAAPASGRGAAEGHRVLPVAAGGRPSRGQARV